MKGLSLFGLAVLIILALLAIEFVVLNMGLKDFAQVKTIILEVGIIQIINEMEFVKKGQEQALPYSFYRAYEWLGMTGGYFNPNIVGQSDCTTYWRVYGLTYAPGGSDLYDNITETSAFVFNTYYISELGAGVFIIPSYAMTITGNPPNIFQVQADAPSGIEFDVEGIKLADEDRFTDNLLSGLVDESGVGRNNFISVRSILNAITSEIPTIPEDCNDRSNQLRGQINANINTLETTVGNIQISISDRDIQVSNTPIADGGCPGGFRYEDYEAAADVLVTIQNNNMEYPIHTDMQRIPLRFRILDGTWAVATKSNPCTETL